MQMQQQYYATIYLQTQYGNQTSSGVKRKKLEEVVG